ncbi:MAG: DUF2971 domain-containing protein [Clostridia bacterium]|nr:DUF2971 domain-containing protein [Clostridia bacterium]
MLYYYCKNSTFSSIIKNRSLWLSDMTQSNDSYEIYKYVDIVKDAIKNCLASLPAINREDTPQKGPRMKEYHQVENLRKVYKLAIKKLSSFGASYYCLAICFSDMQDNLSQWRGYGDDGFGISIGFDEQRIEELYNQHILFKYDDVKYYRSINDELIQEKIRKYLEELKNIGLNIGLAQKDIDHAIKNWCTTILDNDAPFFKPTGFIDERETRFCFVRYIHSPEIARPQAESHLHGVDFHVGNTAIVPHYVLKLEDASGNFMTDVIREVTIGPCNGSTPNTVRLFLAKNGFDYANIIIKKSTIPYRTRR